MSAEFEHRGACMSSSALPAPTMTTSVLTAVSYFRMDLDLQAIVQGAVQTADMMLTIKVLDDENKVQNMQHVTHPLAAKMFDSYHAALKADNTANNTAFNTLWDEFVENVFQQYPFLRKPSNSAENVLLRGRAKGGSAVAWANQGMTNAVLLAMLKCLVKGFKVRNQDLSFVLLRLALLLNSLIDPSAPANPALFVEHFRKNLDKTIIVPIFSPGHAVYAVIKPSSSRPGLFCIAICNGGKAAQMFAEERYSDKFPHEFNFRGHCVVLASQELTEKFLRIAQDNWEVEEVFEKLAHFLHTSEDAEMKRCAELGLDVTANSNFTQLEQRALAEGKTKEFGNQAVFLLEQYQGNCTVLNLIQALAVCDLDKHRTRQVEGRPVVWTVFGGIVYHVTAILCSALIDEESRLRAQFDSYAYDTIVNTLVKQLLWSPTLLDPIKSKLFIDYILYERFPAQNPVGSDGVISYSKIPDGKIVVGKAPVGGWGGVKLKCVHSPHLAESHAFDTILTNWLNNR